MTDKIQPSDAWKEKGWPESNFEMKFFKWMATHPDISELLTQFKLVYEETSDEIAAHRADKMLEARLIANIKQMQIDDPDAEDALARQRREAAAAAIRPGWPVMGNK